MRIENRVAVIAGGASGLGAASARMIAEAGGYVAIVDIDAARGQALAAELGNDTLFAEADVADAAAGEAAVKAVMARFARLDIAINCAGIAPPQRILGKEGVMPLAAFERVMRVNLTGTFNMTRLAAAAMAERAPDEDGERGVIINTGSVAAEDGQIGQAAYSASKGGIVGMTLPIARDLSRDGVRCMTILPGLFNTPLLAAAPEELKKSLGAQVPFPSRLGHPAEYAKLARHICENSMLNGEVIRLDGAIRMAPR